VANLNDSTTFIKSLNIYDENIVLACSYGPDSMVLLNLLSKEKYNIIVAHVNHKLRKESDEEYKLLKEYCKQNNLIFESMDIKDFPKGNMEANARDIRYDFFRKIVKKHDAKYLFTAHHGDDLTETVLMRLIRGASFKAYGGFEKIIKYKDYTLVRPLIYLTKEEITHYADTNNIPYAIDHTNEHEDMTRNRIRKFILPELKKENKNIHKKFIKFNEMISEYENYFDKEIKSLYKKLYLNDRIDINEFMLLDKLLQKRLLNEILLDIYKKEINLINDIHHEMILDLIINDRQNSFIILPNNLKVAKFYNMVIFNYYEETHNNYDFVLKKEVKTPLGVISIIKESNIDKSNNIIRLDSNEINLPIHVRTRRNGDTMKIKNMEGSKKVNDILIDEKVPKNIRDIYPIVVDNDENILWIPGIKKSKNDKQIEETYDIILSYVQGGTEDEKK